MSAPGHRRTPGRDGNYFAAKTQAGSAMSGERGRCGTGKSAHGSVLFFPDSLLHPAIAPQHGGALLDAFDEGPLTMVPLMP
jgi:hypothetical protein